jgi:hypothetical protein
VYYHEQQEYLMRNYGPLVHGGGDIFHLIQLFGWEVIAKSPRASAVHSALLESFFVRDYTDKERELNKLAAKNRYVRVKHGDGHQMDRQQKRDENLLLNNRLYRYRVRRYLRDETVMVKMFEEMFNTYSESQVYSRTQAPLQHAERTFFQRSRRVRH